jgi:hypothetical protein
MTFAGVMGCDWAKIYSQCGRLQWRRAHLKRDFQALIDDAEHQVKRLGHDLMRPTKELFRHWSLCRDGTITRLEFQCLMSPIRHTIDRLLLRGVFSANPRSIGMCRELHDYRDWLWTFVFVEMPLTTIETCQQQERELLDFVTRSVQTQFLNKTHPSMLAGA